MAVNVKMGVDIGGFKNGIKEGQQILKTLDAEIKVAEAEFKATGNAEQLLANKTKTLTSQMNVQKGIMKNAEQALKQMTDAGIKPTDKAYQQLTQQMLKAQAGMLDAQAALNGLDQSQEQAADSADKLSKSVNSIGQKISLDQVISGINTITTGMENAAKKAVSLGETIWNNIMNSAKWADDTATMALMYGIDIDTFQRMQKLVTNGMDTSVDAILKSQQKLMKGLGSENKDALEYLKLFGLVKESAGGKTGEISREFITEDSLDLMFRAGQAIMEMGNGIEAEAKKEAAAQNIFGRSWKELIPLFTQYKTVDEYRKALDGVNVLESDEINQLAELNDKYSELKGNWETLQQEVGAALAPALTGAAEALNGMLSSLLEYLDTPEGKKALEDLGTAVSGLFSDLGKIDPAKVVEGFAGAFNTLVNSITWIKENWEGVKKGIEGILGAFLGMKAVSALLTVAKLIDGMKTLNIIKGTEAAGAAGATTSGGMSIMGALGSLGLTGAVATAPVWISKIVADLIPDTSKIGNAARVQAAEYTGEDLEKVRKWADLQNQLAQVDWINDPAEKIEKITSALAEIGDIQDSDLGRKFWEYLVANDIMAGKSEIPTDVLDSMIKQMQGGQDGLPLTVDPVVPDGTAQDISNQVGIVPILGQIRLAGMGAAQSGADVVMAAAGMMGLLGGGHVKGHANGLWSVPYDGYLARLHRGERIMPAREVASRNYSSNLYVESMYMNNGTDAAGLAAAMAAAQRRTMSGYGS